MSTKNPLTAAMTIFGVTMSAGSKEIRWDIGRGSAFADLQSHQNVWDNKISASRMPERTTSMYHSWTCSRTGISRPAVCVALIFLALAVRGREAAGQTAAADRNAFLRERRAMVDDQIDARGVKDP